MNSYTEKANSEGQDGSDQSSLRESVSNMETYFDKEDFNRTGCMDDGGDITRLLHIFATRIERSPSPAASDNS